MSPQIAILSPSIFPFLFLMVNASKNTGATYTEISETLMHVAVYAGVPASNSAFKILKKVFQESK